MASSLSSPSLSSSLLSSTSTNTPLAPLSSSLSSGSIGLILEKNSTKIFQISSLSPNAAALETVGVGVGDSIVAVNKVAVSPSTVIPALQKAGNEIDVTFRTWRGAMVGVKLVKTNNNIHHHHHQTNNNNNNNNNNPRASDNFDGTELLLDNFQACLNAAEALMNKSIETASSQRGGDINLFLGGGGSGELMSSMERRTLAVTEMLEGKAALKQMGELKYRVMELEEQLQAAEAQYVSENEQLREMLMKANDEVKQWKMVVKDKDEKIKMEEQSNAQLKAALLATRKSLNAEIERKKSSPSKQERIEIDLLESELTESCKLLATKTSIIEQLEQKIEELNQKNAENANDIQQRIDIEVEKRTRDLESEVSSVRLKYAADVAAAARKATQLRDFIAGSGLSIPTDMWDLRSDEIMIIKSIEANNTFNLNGSFDVMDEFDNEIVFPLPGVMPEPPDGAPPHKISDKNDEEAEKAMIESESLLAKAMVIAANSVRADMSPFHTAVIERQRKTPNTKSTKDKIKGILMEVSECVEKVFPNGQFKKWLLLKFKSCIEAVMTWDADFKSLLDALLLAREEIEALQSSVAGESKRVSELQEHLNHWQAKAQSLSNKKLPEELEAQVQARKDPNHRVYRQLFSSSDEIPDDNNNMDNICNSFEAADYVSNKSNNSSNNNQQQQQQQQQQTILPGQQRPLQIATA